MKPTEKQKLLAEILPGDDIREFERTSLELGLASMRQQRRRRDWMRGGALVAVACLAALGIFLNRHSSVRESATVSQSHLTPAPVAPSHVEIINDDQLLALFPGRDVALIGKPGQQRLVFFDQPRNEAAPSQF